MQQSITKTNDDKKGRGLAVTLLKDLMGEIVNWLNFDEAVDVGEELFTKIQTKNGSAKHQVSLSLTLLKLQKEFHIEMDAIAKRIAILEHEKEKTNAEIATLITNFRGFQQNLDKRRSMEVPQT